MGLKDFKWDKSMRFHGNIRELKYALRCAFQRFWRGYDDLYWSYDINMLKQLSIALKLLRDKRKGTPINKNEDEWTAELNRIITLVDRVIKEEDYEDIYNKELTDEIFDWLKENRSLLWD